MKLFIGSRHVLVFYVPSLGVTIKQICHLPKLPRCDLHTKKCSWCFRKKVFLD